MLLTDFQHLMQGAQSLAMGCNKVMTTLADSSILEESRRISDNAERVRKLTILATIFIPLTVCCSIFGMNFHELGSGNLRLWAWFVTAAPVTLVSLIVYHYDGLIKAIRVKRLKRRPE